MLYHPHPAVSCLFNVILFILVNIAKINFLKFLSFCINSGARKGTNPGKGIPACAFTFWRISVSQKLKVGAWRNDGAAVIFNIITNIDDIASTLKGVGFADVYACRVCIGQRNIQLLATAQIKTITASNPA